MRLAFVHMGMERAAGCGGRFVRVGEGESVGVRGGGGERVWGWEGGWDRQCYLWTDIWKEKNKTKARLRLCTPLILPLCLAARVFASSFVPDRPAVRVEYIICQRLLHIRPGLIYQ